MKYECEIITGWKYRLRTSIAIYTQIYGIQVTLDYILLNESGLLTLRPGYAWDGATCYPDSSKILVPSAVHDALCQLMRLELISRDIYFNYANNLLADMCLARDMPKSEVDRIFWGVSNLGKRFTYPEKNPRHKIIMIE